jgi:hypothetical protein
MPQYLIEGRIVPERVDFNAPQLALVHRQADGKEFTARIEIIKSKIFVHVDAPAEIPVADIRNGTFSALSDLVNFAGFQLVLGISYELESITNITEQWTTVFGAEGFVFDDIREFGDRLTFRSGNFGAPMPISVDLFLLRPIARATFELRSSIRYPDFTALHCRLAIEAIRNAFDADAEPNGWQLLRTNLRVGRATIESFKDIATQQRHGKNAPQTWAQRQRCMQIAWEIVHRYTKYITAEPQAPLADYPEL